MSATEERWSLRVSNAVVVFVSIAASAWSQPPSSPVPRCDVRFVGPPGGSPYLVSNCTPRSPRPGDVVCHPDEAGSAASGGEPFFVPYPPPPAPTAIGACCLGASCVDRDYFDCRDSGGWFLESTVCFQGTCDTGVCCGTGGTCAAADGLGGLISLPECDAQGGTFLGGASTCDTDPCARFRIPQGFEIVNVDGPGLGHLQVGLNECGQIVGEKGGSDNTSPENEVYLHENGVVVQLTDDPSESDVRPDINDVGIVVYDHAVDGWGYGLVRRIFGGSDEIIGTGELPRINNHGWIVWYYGQLGGCIPSEFPSDIWLFDGRMATKLVDDGLSNSIPRINDLGHVVWTAFTFPCGGGFGDWTADIMLWRDGPPIALPSTFAQRQGPVIDDSDRIAWLGTGGIEIWEVGTTTLFLPPKTEVEDLSTGGPITYRKKTATTAWATHFFNGLQHYRISPPIEDTTVPNVGSELNSAGEMAWVWLYNFTTPSGIRYMRRIRNGDVNFDRSVTMEDFIPFPGCFTNGEKRDGLCECRFYDIDHDRDIDDDDFALFLRVYTGPLDDCNGNGTSDLVELLHGQAADADLNGVIDACEVLADPAKDLDGDGIIDAACVPVAPSAPWASSGLSAGGGGPLPDGRGTEAERRSHEATERRRDGEAEEPFAGARGRDRRPQGATLQEGHGAEEPVAGARGSAQSTIDNRQSTIPSPQSAIGNRQSAISASPTGRYLSFTVDPGIPPTMNRPAFALDPPAGGWPTQPPYLSTRYYRFQGTSGIPRMAVKVNFVMLPGAYSMFDGTSAWVDTPRPVSELPGKDFNDPVGSDRTFLAARLTDHPVYADFATMGTVYVYDERIIPSRKLPGQTLEPAVYSVQTIIEGCGLATDLNLSPALDVINARWADVAYLVDGQFAAPDGQVSIDDTLAALAKFGAATGAPTKPRADLLGQGATGSTGAVDGKIDISDIIATLNAFAGAEYPYPPPG